MTDIRAYARTLEEIRSVETLSDLRKLCIPENHLGELKNLMHGENAVYCMYGSPHPSAHQAYESGLGTPLQMALSVASDSGMMQRVIVYVFQRYDVNETGKPFRTPDKPEPKSPQPKEILLGLSARA